MHIGKKNPPYTYTMNGSKLEEVAIEKDLGVQGEHKKVAPYDFC